MIERQISSNDLCRYYRFGPHENEESPLATAYAVLALTDTHPDVADRLIDGLGRLQERFAGNPHVGGGVPSIANNDSRLFYASDALAALKAVTTVYRRSGRSEHLHIANGLVEFVLRLTNGAPVGMLAENLGVPMQYATPAGVYQNFIVPNVTMLFWDALHDYSTFGSPITAAAYDRGRAFLLQHTQAPNGAYYDHYEPGWPPRPYDNARWRWFKVRDGRRIGIGDNMFMAALGAARMGDRDGAKRFLRWTAPEAGAFYAYLDIDTGSEGFDQPEQRYFDVVCTGFAGVLQSLVADASLTTRTQRERIAIASEGDDGGFRWGLRPDGAWLQDSAEAVPTGYWLTVGDAP